MRIDTGFGGKESGIRSAHDAYASVVIGSIFYEPCNGVVCVGALINLLGIFMICERAHHHKFAFGFVAAANIFKHENVTADGKLGKLRANVIGVVVGDAVGRAFQDKWQRRGEVRGTKNDGKKFYAVAHGNHHFLAGVRMKIIVDGMIANALRESAVISVCDGDTGNFAGGIGDKSKMNAGLSSHKRVPGFRGKRKSGAARTFHIEVGAIVKERIDIVGIGVGGVLALIRIKRGGVDFDGRRLGLFIFPRLNAARRGGKGESPGQEQNE